MFRLLIQLPMQTRLTRRPVLQFLRPGLAVLLCLISALRTQGYTVNQAETAPAPLCSGMDCRNSSEAPETECNNADGWNLKGSEWGCCGNYDGCCTYASFICYLHDAMCKCCNMGRKLCGPECKPEPDCFEELRDSDKETTGNSTDDISGIDKDQLDMKQFQNDFTEMQNDAAGVEVEKAAGIESVPHNDNHTKSKNTGQSKKQSHLNDTTTLFAHSSDTADENEVVGSGEAEEKVHL